MTSSDSRAVLSDTLTGSSKGKPTVLTHVLALKKFRKPAVIVRDSWKLSFLLYVDLENLIC